LMQDKEVLSTYNRVMRRLINFGRCSAETDKAFPQK